jgi:outer membrane immunogenic protein
MHRLVVASLAVAGLSVGLGAAASAADLGTRPEPVYTKAPIAAPYYSWTGFYAGLNAGDSWSSDNVQYNQIGAPTVLNTNLSKSGFIGGGQVGYNWQTGPLVLGIEADIAWRNNTSSFSTFPFAGNTIDNVSGTDTQKWIGTVRPRIGLAWGSALFYGTGGLAYGEDEHAYTENRVVVPGQKRTLTETDTRTGWTAGGGVELALPAQWNRWSLGAEYLHVDLGTTTLNQPTATVGGLNFPASSTSFHDKSEIIRAKLNYRFN